MATLHSGGRTWKAFADLVINHQILSVLATQHITVYLLTAVTWLVLLIRTCCEVTKHIHTWPVTIGRLEKQTTSFTISLYCWNWGSSITSSLLSKVVLICYAFHVFLYCCSLYHFNHLVAFEINIYLSIVGVPKCNSATSRPCRA